jgi:amino acid permease
VADPDLIRSLDPEKEQIVHLSFIPPEDVGVGAQEVKIKTEALANNRQVQTEDKTVRIQVRAKAEILWTSVLILSGTFDQLTDMLIFVSWIFYAAAAFGVIILRRKMPDHERPYRVWGYPLVPVLFIIFAMIYVVFTLYSDIANYTQGKVPLINSLMGLLLVALGIPGYMYWKRRKKREAS